MFRCCNTSWNSETQKNRWFLSLNFGDVMRKPRIQMHSPAITRTKLKARDKSGTKTVYWSPKHWIYFKTTASILCPYFFVLRLQIQCPFLHTLFVNCIQIPIHLLISLLLVVCFKLLITRTFFDFPRSFELSGVNRTCLRQKILNPLLSVLNIFGKVDWEVVSMDVL